MITHEISERVVTGSIVAETSHHLPSEYQLSLLHQKPDW